MIAFGGAGRRGPGHGFRAVETFRHLAAGVEKLGKDPCAMFVQPLGQAAIARKTGIIRRHERFAGIARGLVHPRNLGDDQPDAAFCPRLVIGDERLADHAALGQNRVVPGRDDAVLHLHRPEPQ